MDSYSSQIPKTAPLRRLLLRRAVFRAGNLYEYDDRGVTIIRAWPRPAAWRRSNNGHLFSDRPDIGLGLFWVDDQLTEAVRRTADFLPAGVDEAAWWTDIAHRMEAWCAFFDTIPRNVRYAIGRYPDHHWAALRLVGGCEDAQQLVTETPALVYCLAAADHFRDRPAARLLPTIRGLLRRGELAALEWLGFPPTNDVLEVLRLYDDRRISAANMWHLRDHVRNAESVAAMRDLPVLTRSVVELCSDSDLRGLFTPSELYPLLTWDDEYASEVVAFLAEEAKGLPTVEMAARRRSVYLQLILEPETVVMDTPF